MRIYRSNKILPIHWDQWKIIDLDIRYEISAILIHCLTFLCARYLVHLQGVSVSYVDPTTLTVS